MVQTAKGDSGQKLHRLDLRKTFEVDPFGLTPEDVNTPSSALDNPKLQT
jgi:hypothetical protein